LEAWKRSSFTSGCFLMLSSAEGCGSRGAVRARQILATPTGRNHFHRPVITSTLTPICLRNRLGPVFRSRHEPLVPCEYVQPHPRGCPGFDLCFRVIALRYGQDGSQGPFLRSSSHLVGTRTASYLMAAPTKDVPACGCNALRQAGRCPHRSNQHLFVPP
jgi:hypothetical protein